MDVPNVEQLGNQISVFATQLTAWAAVAIPSFIGALIMLIAGWWFASRVETGLRHLLARQRHIDPTLSGVVSSLARYTILILVIVAVLGQLGIQTTSVIAALGAAGLAIGLAMQGTLSNIAAGMMLLWLRPFRVGDYIDTGSVAGTVKDVGLFSSELHSWDGIYLFVPNSELWNKRIINFSRLPTRLLDLKFGVAYGGDVGKGQDALLALLTNEPKVLRAPSGPEVFIDALNDANVVLRMRGWVRNADYEALRRAMNAQGKAALEACGLSLTPPPQAIQILRGDGKDELKPKASSQPS
ncbi:MAG: mechanosensitive ion channel family protein [Proteobacteria bacterium]|nr:mechanosensitive ion channel family protein [Pseudomonadota bacterium]